jgi:acyl-CoA synthetase (AMP-forming)/AMP-acid ligase II
MPAKDSAMLAATKTGNVEKLSSMDSFVDILQLRATETPTKCVFTYLKTGEVEETHLTFGELHEKARQFAGWLLGVVKPDDRVLLMLPPGIDYVVALCGCLCAGVVAVPVPFTRPAHGLTRFEAIAASARARAAITVDTVLAKIRESVRCYPELGALNWLVWESHGPRVEHTPTEVLPSGRGDSTAILQYTSGSTGSPKGVVLTHRNLVCNSEIIRQKFGHTSESSGVIWLPPFHDMGLIGGILQPLYSGFHTVLMSPWAFLRRPFCWLKAISDYRATTSGGPNFAYELCISRVTEEQKRCLDLTCWKIAFVGAEPVRAATLQRFSEAFGISGFRKNSFYPCYGLAEATLLVSGGEMSCSPVTCRIDRSAAEQHRVLECHSSEHDVQTLVGCGSAAAEHKLVVVNPETLIRCAPDEIGEIWVSGPSVAQGYFGLADETKAIFSAFLANTGEGPFLRTGDLGFVRRGQVFVTGRRKDLIIIYGRNHCPEDIEATVSESHPLLRGMCTAAFSAEIDGGERLVVLQEFERHQRDWIPEFRRRIQQAVTEKHDIHIYDLAFLSLGGIPKTSSGKIQRQICRERYLSGSLSAAQ